MATDRCMDRGNVVYIQWNIMQPLNRKKSCNTTLRMNLGKIILSEISPEQKDKYCAIPRMWVPNVVKIRQK